ncbi:hypothetical protein KSX_13740 [Ktedonospora formicarum]|uniref:Response regulatory domain-containing protein n=2 Tax=Ktedonospora formicarum TaxID=2778364 RepID=A0A8J3MQW9_9CHLR|nr:hypothetical protein KSX_13740 [Ktedonospora formicarum]
MLVLQDEDYEVIAYPDAEACLDALRIEAPTSKTTSIDLLIVDWRLNGTMSGIEVIKCVRSVPYLAELPIILTTAATFTDIESLRDLQVSLLEKPFSVDEIISLIKRVTGPLASS